MSSGNRLDLLVDDLVVVEAKAVDKLVDAHFAQLSTQLLFSGMEVGLLLNFRQWPFKEGGIKRVIQARSASTQRGHQPRS